MNSQRPDCDQYKNSAFTQGACRRDLTVAIVKDWLTSRGHQSVRFVLSEQSSWPEYALLFKQLLLNVETSIDTNFVNWLPREATFLHEICGQSGYKGLWIDYAFYVRRLMKSA